MIEWILVVTTMPSSLLSKRPYIPGDALYLSAMKLDAKWEALPHVEGLLLSASVWMALRSWRLLELNTWSRIDGIKLRRGRRSVCRTLYTVTVSTSVCFHGLLCDLGEKYFWFYINLL